MEDEAAHWIPIALEVLDVLTYAPFGGLTVMNQEGQACVKIVTTAVEQEHMLEVRVGKLENSMFSWHCPCNPKGVTW